MLQIPALRLFGLFMAMMVLMNYVRVVLVPVHSCSCWLYHSFLLFWLFGKFTGKNLWTNVNPDSLPSLVNLFRGASCEMHLSF